MGQIRHGNLTKNIAARFSDFLVVQEAYTSGVRASVFVYAVLAGKVRCTLRQINGNSRLECARHPQVISLSGIPSRLLHVA